MLRRETHTHRLDERTDLLQEHVTAKMPQSARETKEVIIYVKG